GNPTLSMAMDCVAVSMPHSIGHGLSTSFSALSLEAIEIEMPSFTSAAACLRLAGVMRLSVPSSSSFPHRPQLDNSVRHRSYSAFVTRGCVAFCCGPAAIAPKAIKTAVTVINVFIVPPRGCTTRIVDLLRATVQPFKISTFDTPANVRYRSMPSQNRTDFQREISSSRTFLRLGHLKCHGIPNATDRRRHLGVSFTRHEDCFTTCSDC